LFGVYAIWIALVLILYPFLPLGRSGQSAQTGLVAQLRLKLHEVLQALVVRRCSVPETRVSGVGEHSNYGAGDASHLLIDDIFA
jgi:hypothetical protein